jgi:hypothetical protein
VIDRAIFVANRALPIDGGWAEALHGIADSASLLATAPKNSNAYLSNSFNINPDELRFNKSTKMIRF